jgi:hypothetical protein
MPQENDTPHAISRVPFPCDVSPLNNVIRRLAAKNEGSNTSKGKCNHLTRPYGANKISPFCLYRSHPLNQTYPTLRPLRRLT